MPYLFATQDQPYTDFASGRVIYNAPGMPAFPVRLASEMFQRARALLPGAGRLVVYDPTCGGAYHLAALGLLHGAHIGAILASDVDEAALKTARRNLGLLIPAGLDRREAEIRALLEQYGKDSHREALRSVAVFRQYLEQAAPIATRAFAANALDAGEISAGLAGQRVDLVLADVPYGHLSQWRTPVNPPEDAARQTPLWHMLDALLAVLPSGALVAVALDKSQKAAHGGYRRVEHFQVGKRRVALLRRADSTA